MDLKFTDLPIVGELIDDEVAAAELGRAELVRAPFETVLAQKDLVLAVLGQ